MKSKWSKREASILAFGLACPMMVTSVSELLFTDGYRKIFVLVLSVCLLYESYRLMKQAKEEEAR